MTTPTRDSATAVSLRPATLDDLPLLAEMNHQLIADEGSRNPMDVAALAERMRGWLAGGYHILVVERDGAVSGYAVYQVRPDEYDPAQHYTYLRQFYVRREARRLGIGRAAFQALHALMPADLPLCLDVLECNAGGRAFWEALGFRPYCTAMRLD